MKLDLISFNIRCCDDPDGHSIAERAPRLQKIVSPVDADVIAFQEIRPKWVPEIETRFLNDYDMYLCYRSETKPEGLITLWKKDRFECSERGFFWFSDTPNEESLGWDEKYHCPRICSYVVLKEKGTDSAFLMMNTHFGFGENCHLKSVELIRSFRSAYEDLPAFIAGDFNMLPMSSGHLAMQKYFVDVNGATLNDRRTTFHGYDPSVSRQQHIDYIFCDPDIKGCNFRFLDAAIDGKFPSDHFGIAAELIF